MIEPVQPSMEAIERPDISHLVMEDGEPLDGPFQERQMRLLVDSLYASWDGNGRDFAAFANVGLFFGLNESPVVPDVMVSLDVKLLQDPNEEAHKSYLVWEYGKPPDVVIEVVSNRVGGEEAKLDKYARVGVPYAVIYDPGGFLGPLAFRMWQRNGRGYVEMVPGTLMPGVDLSLTQWKGTYQGIEATWLRWCDESGRMLLTGAEAAEAAKEQAKAAKEQAKAAKKQADASKEQAQVAHEQAKAAQERTGVEREMAEVERKRAEAERERADAAEAQTRRLLERLRELGEDVPPA